MKSAGYLCGNQLLDALPFGDRADLEADLEILTLVARDPTHFVDTSFAHLDFPIDAVISVVATLQNGEIVEVGTVGSESFVGTDVVLDSTVSQRAAFCQVRGTVGRMSIARFESRMAASAPFARAMRRNVRASLFSAQQFAVCNAKHSIQQRCARWLAMTEDRVGGPTFKLTHEFLAVMLGVWRPGVSTAADALQKAGAITYSRGAVRVLDPMLLRAAACECYEACNLAYSVSLHDADKLRHRRHGGSAKAVAPRTSSKRPGRKGDRTSD